MDSLLHKLNYKGISPIFLLDPPADFLVQWQQQLPNIPICTNLEPVNPPEFVLAFVTTQEQVNQLVHKLAPKLIGDAILWLAYPKGTSKKYRCDFNRDTGWAVFGQYGFETVRQIAIDEDWTALRFRRSEYIKTMKRDPVRTISEGGKAKLSQ